MTWDEALGTLADHPHAWRFRELCEDDSDPERRDGYRGHVVRLARGEMPTPAPAPTPAADYGTAQPARPCCGGAPPGA